MAISVFISSLVDGIELTVELIRIGVKFPQQEAAYYDSQGTIFVIVASISIAIGIILIFLDFAVRIVIRRNKGNWEGLILCLSVSINI